MAQGVDEMRERSIDFAFMGTLLTHSRLEPLEAAGLLVLVDIGVMRLGDVCELPHEGGLDGLILAVRRKQKWLLFMKVLLLVDHICCNVVSNHVFPFLFLLF